MEITINNKINLKGVEIYNIDFKVFDFLANQKNVPILFDLKAGYHFIDKSNFIILIKLSLQSETIEKGFKLDLEGLGKFNYSEKISKIECVQMINDFGMSLIFPYFRNFISTITANAEETMGHFTLPLFEYRGKLSEINLDKGISPAKGKKKSSKKIKKLTK